MGAPEPVKSVHERLSTALDKLEKLTSHTDDHAADHEEHKTVEEAVVRMKQKFPDAG